MEEIRVPLSHTESLWGRVCGGKSDDLETLHCCSGCCTLSQSLDGRLTDDRCLRRGHRCRSHHPAGLGSLRLGSSGIPLGGVRLQHVVRPRRLLRRLEEAERRFHPAGASRVRGGRGRSPSQDGLDREIRARAELALHRSGRPRGRPDGAAIPASHGGRDRGSAVIAERSRRPPVGSAGRHLLHVGGSFR